MLRQDIGGLPGGLPQTRPAAIDRNSDLLKYSQCPFKVLQLRSGLHRRSGYMTVRVMPYLMPQGSDAFHENWVAFGHPPREKEGCFDILVCQDVKDPRDSNIWTVPLMGDRHRVPSGTAICG